MKSYTFATLVFLACFANNANAITEDSIFKVHYYSLNLNIESNGYIKGYVDVHLKSAQLTPSINFEANAKLNIDKVQVNGKKVKFIRKLNYLLIPNKGKYSYLVVRIYYSGIPKVAINPPWQGGISIAKDNNSKPWLAMSCEADGASTWWPCIDTWAVEPDSVSLSFNVDSVFTVVSNGQLRSIKNLKNRTEYNYHVSYPVNLYNITFNIGKYKTHSFEYQDSLKGNLLDIQVSMVNYKNNADFEFFRANISKMLEAFEYYFGKYPFANDGYKLVEAPYWGMEHQTCVAYGNKKSINKFGFDYILVHESGHEWWGNAVSGKSRNDMWIHESFTTYSEYLYVKYWSGPQLANLYIEQQRNQVFNSLPMVLINPKLPITFTDNDIYYKGAGLLHQYENLVSDSVWRNCLIQLQNKYKYKTVDTDEILNEMQRLTGLSAANFKWYLTHPYLPILEWNIEPIGENEYELSYKWNLSETDGEFDMPVKIVLNGEVGQIIYPNSKQKTRTHLISEVEPRLDASGYYEINK